MIFSKIYSVITPATPRGLLYRLSAVFVFGFLGLFSIMMLHPQVGSAVVDQKTDPLLTYCQSVANKKSQEACLDPDMLAKAKKVAKAQCANKKDPKEKDECITNKSRAFIKEAAKKDTGSGKELKAGINKILNRESNDTDGNCSASDGLCADCNSNSADKNPDTQCVRCEAGQCADPAVECKSGSCDLIKKYVNPAINLFTVMFGLIAAASLIFGGITYAASEGDPQKVAKAKDRIAKTIFAVVAYMFLYSFIQFLVPGGAFKQ